MSLVSPWRRPFPALPNPRPRIVAAIQAFRARIEDARLTEAGTRSALDAVAPDWVETLPGAYVIGNETTRQEWHTATLVIRNWPSSVQAGWLAPALFGTANGDVSVAIHSTRLSKSAARRLLKTQRVLQTSVAQSRAERGAIADPAEELDLHSAEVLAPLVEDNAECLFAANLVLTLRAPSQAALDALVVEVQEALNVPDFGGMRWQQRDGFLSAGVPYAADRVGRRKTIDTTSHAMSFPFLTSDVGTQDGPFWGISTADKSPVRIDLWSRDEGWQGPHLAVVGLNGGGKSVLFGHLLAEHAAQPDPPDLLVIDPAKGDYRRFVDRLGGQIIRMGAGFAHSINAFDLGPAVLHSGTGEEAKHNPVLTQTRLSVGLIALMVAEDDQPLRKAERAVIETAILSAYASKGITPQDEESWQADRHEVPTLPDVLAALMVAGSHGGGESIAARSVAERLQPYCTGTLANLFSQPTTLSLDAGITSFDLEHMDEEARPLVTWLLAHFVWQLAKRDRRKRILALEEVRTLLASPESARLVGDMYAMGRAYALSVWSATQLLADFTTVHEGRRSLDNAHTVVHLRAAPGAGSAAVQERYGLSESDRLYLETCEQGHGMVFTPKGNTRLAIYPSPLELELMGGPIPTRDPA